jgi:hypothetical protein
MMEIFYDCEFLEDGATVEPISIGMVREDGTELYCVFEEIEADPLYGRIRNHQWLMKNVVPHLPLRDEISSAYDGVPARFHLDDRDNTIMPRRMIRNAVRDFVLDTPEPELWAWYGAYDHVMLAQLFGPMIHLPKGFPMWTNDLQQEIARHGNPALPPQPTTEHHALADAHYNRAVHGWLRTLDG